MNVRIGKGKARGTAQAPPSKSMAHRLLICAGLAEGTSEIRGIARSEDVAATIDCLSSLGALCQRKPDEEETLLVTGAGSRVTERKNRVELPCRESGSTLRFFIPLCLLSDAEAVLYGSERLLERPLTVYEELCRRQNLTFCREKDRISLKGPLEAGTFRVPGNISSQFISGLLLALPLLKEESRLEIVPPVESRPYIEMTLSALETFGIIFQRSDENTIIIKGGQSCSPRHVKVEGDYSNAAFFQALDILGGDVCVEGLNPHSLQGDKVCGSMLELLKNGRPELDISQCPDLGPVLFAVAASSGRGAVFTGTDRLRIKESDRAGAMADVLSRFGVKTVVRDSRFEVSSGGLAKPLEPLPGYNDHRIVMAEAVLLTLTGGIIEGAEAVSKSFPDFFERLRALGIEVEKIED